MEEHRHLKLGISIPQIFGGPRVDTSLCAIVAELSRLLDEPGLWADLLGTSSRSTGRNGSSGKHSRPRGARLRDPTR